MDFLKNFFDDDAKIIGLCGFDSIKPNYTQKVNAKDRGFRQGRRVSASEPSPSERGKSHFPELPIIQDRFLEYFNKAKTFETKFSGNVFLQV